MDEKTSNQMINLLASIERKLSSIAKMLEEKSKSK
jgi:DNA-binding FrmR family transcriptional regulator